MAKAKKKKKDNKPERIKFVTPEFRGSYANLNEARKFGKGEPKFSVLGVFDEDDPFVAKMQKAEATVAKEKWNKVPKKMKSAIKFPADREAQLDDDEEDKFPGKVTINFANKEKPGAVQRDSDGDLVEVIDPKELYSGAWYRASVRPYAWEYEDTNSLGVSWSLDNIMKIRDDEAFTSATSAEEDFENIVDDDDDDDDDDDEEDLVG